MLLQASPLRRTRRLSGHRGEYNEGTFGHWLSNRSLPLQRSGAYACEYVASPIAPRAVFLSHLMSQAPLRAPTRITEHGAECVARRLRWLEGAVDHMPPHWASCFVLHSDTGIMTLPMAVSVWIESTVRKAAPVLTLATWQYTSAAASPRASIGHAGCLTAPITAGAEDHFCVGANRSPTMCQHLVDPASKGRWLIWPQISQCCFCCTLDFGCGDARPIHGIATCHKAIC